MRLRFLLVFIIFFSALRSSAYSNLTHEAMVDAAWEKNIIPLLKQKFPNITGGEIKEARAYAYGGALTPDIQGSTLFGDLMHYVRNGCFISTMLQDAADINEYAFALGFLAHYYGDCYGHPIAINRSVPLMFPKLRAKLGDTITYSQHGMSHLRAELSFDVLQTVRGNYTSEVYRNYIGFKISEPLLKKALLKTYGLSLDDLFSNFSKTTRTYRWGVRDVFPLLTRAAWRTQRKEILKTSPRVTRRSYIYRMHAAEYKHEYGADYKPGPGARLVAAMVRIMPKIGRLKKFKFVVPGPEAEKFFINSFDSAVRNYNICLAKINAPIPDRIYDTGKKTKAGEYDLADNAYADLLFALQKRNFTNVPPELKQYIIAFYNEPGAGLAMSRRAKNENKINTALKELNAK